MKKILLILSIFLLCGCSQSTYQEIEYHDGTLRIPISSLSSEAIFYNYYADNQFIQLIAVKDDQEEIHVFLNTCEECTSSTYFVQEDHYLVGSTCETKYDLNTMNVGNDLCAPVEFDEYTKEGNYLLIDPNTLDDYFYLFEGWNGITS